MLVEQPGAVNMELPVDLDRFRCPSAYGFVFLAGHIHHPEKREDQAEDEWFNHDIELKVNTFDLSVENTKRIESGKHKKYKAEHFTKNNKNRDNNETKYYIFVFMLTTDQSLRILFSNRGWYKGSGIHAGTARVYKKRFLENSLEWETRVKILRACSFRIIQEMQWESCKEEDLIKSDLAERLKQQKAFWSYDPASITTIPDKVLIEKVLLYLDIEDINRLFNLFPKKAIKKIWKEKMLIQEPMYHGLNRLFAFLYFEIKDPDRYIREFVKKRHQSIQCKD